MPRVTRDRHVRAGPRQPHGRPHRHHRRARAPDGDRPRHDRRRATPEATGSSSARTPSRSLRSSGCDGSRAARRTGLGGLRGRRRRRGRARHGAARPGRARPSRSVPGCRRAPPSSWRVALALGADPDPRALALLGQRAEQRGLGRALRDHGPAHLGRGGRGPRAAASTATTSRSSRCRCPTTSRWWWCTPACPRTLAGSAYAERRRECEAAEARDRPAAPGPTRRRASRSPTRCCAAGPATC